MCVCVAEPPKCVHYHLHGVCEHHTVEADQVLVVQGVHGVDLADEVLQSVGLAQHVRLQTLDSHVELERHVFSAPRVCVFRMMLHVLTSFPVGVSHSPLFTSPKDPSPSFSNRVRSFSGMRQVRAWCCPSRSAPPPPSCRPGTPS